jgi:alpha-tubulin suppressor-like RCC1 family protein
MLLFQIKMVSCGGDHTVVLTEEGKAYSFGLSTNGQLGLGTRILEASKPTLLAALNNMRLVQVTEKLEY